MNTKVVWGIAAVLVIGGIAGVWIMQKDPVSQVPLDAMPRTVTLAGQYVCLPHTDTTGPQTEECAFGLQTDAGDYYAVNFGQSADAMQQFQSRVRIRAEGFIVIREALSSDQWQKYNMKGVFTITRMLDVTDASSTSTAPEMR
jgi:hypothetical protein